MQAYRQAKVRRPIYPLCRRHCYPSSTPLPPVAAVAAPRRVPAPRHAALHSAYIACSVRSRSSESTTGPAWREKGARASGMPVSMSAATASIMGAMSGCSLRALAGAASMWRRRVAVMTWRQGVGNGYSFVACLSTQVDRAASPSVPRAVSRAWTHIELQCPGRARRPALVLTLRPWSLHACPPSPGPPPAQAYLHVSVKHLLDQPPH
jgi:hypothetical protein